MSEEEGKTCRVCGKWKVLSDFYAYTGRNGKSSRWGTCRLCVSAQRQEKKASADTSEPVGGYKEARAKKKCVDCGQVKEAKHFHMGRKQGGKVYRNQPCKPCSSERYRRAKAEKNKEPRKSKYSADAFRRSVKTGPMEKREPKVPKVQPYPGVTISDLPSNRLVFPKFKGYGYGDE